MPVFAEAFGYTPQEFRALSYPDFAALVGFLRERVERANRG